MPHINRTIFMPVDLLEAFSKHTGLSWSSLEIEGAMCDAIAAAMHPQPQAAPAQAPQPDHAAGYQWKQLFLPAGTVLRASFGRQPYYAVVEGTQIKYGQYSLSPSAFANLQGSGNRNAWKAVWLRFPGCRDWVRADECRAVRRAMTTRMFEPGEVDEPVEYDERDSVPVAHAGCHQQHYAESKPSRDDAVPIHTLLKDEPIAPKSSLSSPPPAGPSRTGMKRSNARHGKRRGNRPKGAQTG